MMRIAFFIENHWSFGKIHNEMVKALYPDVYCDMLPWNQSYTRDNFDRFLRKYDYVLTTPNSAIVLHKSYGVPWSRIIAALHGDHDLVCAFKDGADDSMFDALGGYVAISPLLQSISLSMGVARVPHLTRLGKFTANYHRHIPGEVSKMGYFSAYKRIDRKIDIKRGFLASRVADATGLKLVHYEDVHHLASETMYDEIDLLIYTSTQEGLPTPMLEAFASGIPVLGTMTGIAPHYVRYGGIVELPMTETELVSCAVEAINRIKTDAAYYRELCEAAYRTGQLIDWSQMRGDWINYINSLPSIQS